MKLQHILPALALPLILGACDRQAPADPPKPQVTAPANESVTPPVGSSSEKLVPGPTGAVSAVPPSSVTGNAPAPGDAGKDSPATQPASTLSESEEENKMPLAGQAGSHSSDSFEAGASK